MRLFHDEARPIGPRDSEWNHRNTIAWALVKTVYLLALIAIFFDSSRIQNAAVAGLAAYWGMSGLIWTRRDRARPFEVMFTRHGIWGILVAVLVTASFFE